MLKNSASWPPKKRSEAAIQNVLRLQVGREGENGLSTKVE